MPASKTPDADFQTLVRARFADDPRAIGELGGRLLVGRDSPVSPVDGAALIEEAANRGDAIAWRSLGILAASGVVRAQSWKEAFDALSRAADLGESDAARQLSVLRDVGLSSGADASGWVRGGQSRTINESPRFLACAALLPPAVCAYLIECARPKLVQARVFDAAQGVLREDPMRTNTCAVFSLIDFNLVMQLARARIAATANVAMDALEPAEVLHYSVGERYKQHVDFFHPAVPNFAEQMRTKGQRIKTCLVYLNDDFEGGATEFPKLDLKFRGATGEALIFDNVRPNGAGDMKTVHTGTPTTRGEKWLLSQWIRNKAQTVA